MAKIPFFASNMSEMIIGNFNIDDVDFEYQATILKHEHVDSINGGKVYELKIVDYYHGYPMVLYEFKDGVWVTKPKNETDLAKRALEYVLKMYS